MLHDPLTPDVGVIPIDETTALWRVWAPHAGRVELIIEPGGRAERVGMKAEGHGYFACSTPTPKNGLRYSYGLDGGPPLPDPASRWQIDGVNAPSAVYFPNRFAWNEGRWAGIERKDLVLYELHVGTFTPEGTFDAIGPRIDDLLKLGVSAIELMPVAQFPGVRSWGYDGVHPFAVQQSYGGPEALQRLIATCHRKGMAVILDVIYNHFGPEGNILPRFGDYLTEKHKTAWGAAVNYDDRNCDPVRAMMLQNARMWVRDFRLDGLRLDATDQIHDQSPRHILSEIVEAAHDEADTRGRQLHVFAETDLNDAPRFLHPRERGGYGVDGHWNDDFHHALHVVLTGETNGYYVDFAPGPAALAKVLNEGFVNNGTYSEFRGRRHGTDASEFAGDRFVAFTQNHDQVGNRLHSDRYAATLGAPAARLAAGVLLLAPRLPLLFMGEEYGETNPFPYFCDFESPELVDAVRKGRKAEFAHFDWDDEPSDPFDPATRDSAVLSWSWNDPVRGGLRRLYADLLRLRRKTPALRDFTPPRARIYEKTGLLEMIRGIQRPDSKNAIAVVFNLGKSSRRLPEPYIRLRPSLRSEMKEYGAPEPSGPGDEIRPYEFVVFDSFQCSPGAGSD